MAPSEEAILSNYLLLPARLTDVLTLDQFRALFPRPLQGSAQVRSLYRDLQHRRGALVGHVRDNIAAELEASRPLRRRVARERLRCGDGAAAGGVGGGVDYIDDEIEIERALFGDASGARPMRHTLASAVPALAGAAGALETEIAALEAEERALLAEIGRAVGALSDLRYGRLENANLAEEALQSLDAFGETCAGRI